MGAAMTSWLTDIAFWLQLFKCGIQWIYLKTPIKRSLCESGNETVCIFNDNFDGQKKMNDKTSESN